jgi:uncharacterized protein (TIRG00374 family)
VAPRLVRAAETALIPLGIAAIAVLVWQIGPDERSELVSLVSLVKWWFLAIVLQEAVAHGLNTLGLLACLPLDRKKIGFAYAFGARLAGEGMNATMPTATVGGELLKISLLSRRAAPNRVTAGVSSAYASQTLAQMLFTALALPLSLPALHLRAELKWAVAVFVLGGLVAAYAMVSATRSGVFAKIHGVFQWAGIGKEGSTTHKATASIDDAARDASSADPHGFALAILYFFLAWLWGVVEVGLTFHACGKQVDLVQCLAIESLSSYVDSVCFFVPGQMGTRELGLVGILGALGLDAPMGISLGLVRRARVLAWAVLGLACLARLRRSGDLAPATAHESSVPIERRPAQPAAIEAGEEPAAGGTSVLQ